MHTKDDFLKEIYAQFQMDIDRVVSVAIPTLSVFAEAIANCFLAGGKLMVFSHHSPLVNSVNIASIFINSEGNKRPPYPVVAIYTGDKGFMAGQVSANAAESDIVWGFTADKIDDVVKSILRTGGQNGAKTACFAIDDDSQYNGLCDHIITLKNCGILGVSLMQLYIAVAVVKLVDEIMFGDFS